MNRFLRNVKEYEACTTKQGWYSRILYYSCVSVTIFEVNFQTPKVLYITYLLETNDDSNPLIIAEYPVSIKMLCLFRRFLADIFLYNISFLIKRNSIEMKKCRFSSLNAL